VTWGGSFSIVGKPDYAVSVNFHVMENTPVRTSLLHSHMTKRLIPFAPSGTSPGSCPKMQGGGPPGT
jgi:hypothetical protein